MPETLPAWKICFSPLYRVISLREGTIHNGHLTSIFLIHSVLIVETRTVVSDCVSVQCLLTERGCGRQCSSELSSCLALLAAGMVNCWRKEFFWNIERNLFHSLRGSRRNCSFSLTCLWVWLFIIMIFLKISILLLREGITLSVYTVSSVRTLFLKGFACFFCFKCRVSLLIFRAFSNVLKARDEGRKRQRWEAASWDTF